MYVLVILVPSKTSVKAKVGSTLVESVTWFFSKTNIAFLEPSLIVFISNILLELLIYIPLLLSCIIIPCDPSTSQYVV